MKIWLAALCALLALGVSAEEGSGSSDKIHLPAYYPDGFEQRGVIDSIVIKNGVNLTVSGLRYPVISNPQVHFLSSEYGSVNRLKVGMGIGFRLVDTPSGRQVAEIWELPAELTPPPS